MTASDCRPPLFLRTHAVRHFCVVSAFLIGGISEAGQPRWRPVNMSLGCVPFSDLYAIHPELSAKTTPKEVVEALKVRVASAKAQSFLDFLETGLKSMKPSDEKDIQEAEYKSMRKLYTKSNAIITWSREGDRDDGFLLYTEELCISLYGSLAK